MAFNWFVVGGDISRLNPDDFRAVLNALLIVEANANSVSMNRLSFSTRNYDPDGGVDALVDWPVIASSTVIPAGKNVVQYKAGKLTGEILAKELNKPGVKKAVRSGAHYLLFVGHDYGAQQANGWRKKLGKLFRRHRWALKRAHIVFASEIAEWICHYPSVIILPELRKNLPYFQTVNVWSQAHKLPWNPDPARVETLEKLHAFLQDNGPINLMRVEGPLGVGKTRVVLEAVREKGLSESVIYSPNGEDESVTALLAFVQCSQRARAIIVVDECSFDRQIVFRHYTDASGGRLRLICVGTPDLLAPRLAASPSMITLNPLSDKQMREILAGVTTPMPKEILDLAVKLSSGLIKLGIFVVRQLVENAVSLVELTTIGDVGEFLRRFVRPAILDPLEAFSLLARVGWEEEVSGEAKALAAYLNIPFQMMQDGVQILRNQGLIMAQGRYLYVTPDLLAIFASSLAWQKRGPDLIEIVGHLPGPASRRQLLIRIASMGHHPKVQKAIERLLGEEGIYKSLPDLDDEFRGEMLRILSSAMPDAVADVLERIINKCSREELTGFKTGRREVMWALESLLRWPNTSLTAARILRSLALAENESIGNNATGIFRQYFQMYLSGSPIPISERFVLLDELMESGDLAPTVLAAKALDSALGSYESRMGPDADQISGRSFPRDWRPSSREELREARLPEIDRALQISGRDDEAGKIARGALTGAAFTLIREGLWEEAISALEKLTPFSDKDKRDILDAAKRIEREVAQFLLPEQKHRLEILSGTLFDNSFRGRLHRWVGHRLHADFDLAGDTGFQGADAETAKLATEAFQSGLSQEDIEWLGTPEAENVWILAVELGKLDSESKLLDSIQKASRRDINCLFLAGYLTGQSELKGDPFRDAYLDQLAVTEPVLAFGATWRSKATLAGLSRIFSLVDSGAIDPEMLGYMAYGGWTIAFSAREIRELLSRLLKGNVQRVMDPAMSIARNLLQRNPEAIDSIEEVLWKMLSVKPERSWQWLWGQVASKLVNRDPERMVRIILSFFEADHFVPLSSESEMELLAKATEIAPKACWEAIGSILLREDNLSHRVLISLRGWFGELIPANDLLSWAQEHEAKGPRIAAQLIRATGPDLPQRAKMLLSNFPEDNYVRNAIVGNLLSGAWVGPHSKKIEQDLLIAEGWARDDDPRIRKFAREVIKGLKMDLSRHRLWEEEGRM